MATKYVGFRLTEVEYEKFAAKAATANMALTEYLRNAILSDNTIIKAKPPKLSKDRKEMFYIFNKTSNNLNQLAYLANTHNKLGTLTDKNHQSILANLITIRNIFAAKMKEID